MNMKYAVITVNSFDEFVPVKLLATYKEAKKYLKDTYEEELRIDVEENGYSVTSCYDENYAEITQHFHDHNNTTKFFIGDIV